MLAVTGTDGKTTTTLWAVEMLAAAGMRAVAAGNTEVPLVTAIDMDLDAFVVECTSFRLALTERFRGEAAAWLNLAPDHLNWHRSMDTYGDAKNKIFANQHPDDVAIGFARDAEVMRRLAAAPARHVTFGGADSDYRVTGDTLVGPSGELAPVAALRRRLPHDLTNGLAAAALVLESRTRRPDSRRRRARRLHRPAAPHRARRRGRRRGLVQRLQGHDAARRVGGDRRFDHVVLIAGGRNKGLDLSPMADASTAGRADRVRAVVAIGEAADVIADAFGGRDIQILRASSMPDAVDVAGAAARPGDVVLLSPGCASFDWYPDGGYEARGDHFRELVRSRLMPHDLQGAET